MYATHCLSSYSAFLYFSCNHLFFSSWLISVSFGGKESSWKTRHSLLLLVFAFYRPKSVNGKPLKGKSCCHVCNTLSFILFCFLVLFLQLSLFFLADFGFIWREGISQDDQTSSFIIRFCIFEVGHFLF